MAIAAHTPRRLDPALRAVAAVCLLLLALFGLASCGAAVAAVDNKPLRITGLDTRAEAGRTVVTISYTGGGDAGLPARIFALPNPEPRLVFDFPKLAFAVDGKDTGRQGGEGLVRQVRWAHTSDTVSRVVLDLSGPVQIARQEVLGGLGGPRVRLELEPGTPAKFAAIRVGSLPTTVASASARPAVEALRPRSAKPVVVIDAGHGGRDPGAVGAAKTVEKDVNLAAALALRDILNATGRYKVVMTRDSDRYISLERRVDIARKANAELFISLHADSGGPTAEGASLYTLSDKGGERARSLMARQDWVVGPARDTSGEVSEILTDLTQRDTRNQSAAFAQALLPELAQAGPMLRNTHRQAGFFVLLAPDVAAILLEMGFLSSAEDEKRLADPAFRKRQMAAVARAIDAHFAPPTSVAASR